LEEYIASIFGLKSKPSKKKTSMKEVITCDFHATNCVTSQKRELFLEKIYVFHFSPLINAPFSENKGHENKTPKAG
jgi:hypothetical protein